ncbi:nuclear protein localization protein 4 homolog [Culicoides brevitarsis]|uniref:nuclear protein localization protein 4 homolog n=1 Tax=Culicoides brevitarsis TaxID=469753 RepID=UPI00307B9580
MTDKIILRIQTPNGTRRLEVQLKSSLRRLFEDVHACLELDTYNFRLFKDRLKREELISSSKCIESANLRHGDMLYLSEESGAMSDSSSKKKFDQIRQNNKTPSMHKEDEVDLQLYKLDGKIQRKRDDKMCRHTSKGCCVHCSALEPWDETYLKDQKIKHLSFHSYIRKLTSGVDRGKFVALEDLNCKIKPGCRDHLPWPKGICSKCQPSAITLNRQSYRHVDNIMFENILIVERFLNYWRCSGHQRMGLLYGNYEIHPEVPLGIRARVMAIYEPPQESSRDYIKILEDPNQSDVDEVSNALGIRCVGWIFTDLLTDDAALGTVKQTRGIDTYFLSAQECILAGNLQNSHPNASKHSSTGFFGSKFSTVCVTGDSKKQVHMEGYAVSAQCMALVRDNCLLPTKDAPELGYIRESSDKQYVPDVYYKEKDVYGNEVQRLGRPLPVEYLLVDIPASTPVHQLHTFTAREDKGHFPIENRFLDGHIQDFTALSNYLSKWNSNEFIEAVSDFHLLIYLYRMDMLPLRSEMSLLFEAIKTKDTNLALKFKTKEVWCTLEQLISASVQHDVSAQSLSSTLVADTDDWVCNHCTFLNTRSGSQTCDICNLPRN